jgi:hypothetical protein
MKDKYVVSVGTQEDNDFYLYKNCVLIGGAEPYIGNHLEKIGWHVGVNLSECKSESDMISVLQKAKVDIDVGDW